MGSIFGNLPTEAETWENLTNGYGTPNGKNVHPDQHAIAFSGNGGSFFYIGNDGGVWKTSDGGTDFTDCNTDLSTIQFYGMDADQAAPANTVGGTQDNGTEEGTEPSLVWNEIYGGDGGYTNVDPTDSNVIYGEYVYGDLLKSTNSGESFASITTGIGESGYWITPYVLDPENTTTLFTATSKIYRSTNGGNSWSARTSYLRSSSDLVTTLSISPPETNVMYAGISGYRGADVTAYLYLSTNSGSTWSNITGDLPTGCRFLPRDGRPVTERDGIPRGSFGGPAHILKTSDYGSTWTALSSTSNGFDDVPTKVICIDSLTRNIYAGTYWGIYRSTDDGSTWSKLSTGLPNAVVDDISIQYSTYELRVGTHGRGIWSYSLADQSLMVQVASWNALQSDRGVQLMWSTQSEVRNAGFKILREAPSDSNWQVIADYTTDDSLRGLGTTSIGKDYSYLDGEVVFGASYRYRLQSVLTEGSITNLNTMSVTFNVPRDYALSQNYPNPFNPLTKITYRLPEASHVTLKVYDVLGRQVATLVERNAGRGKLQCGVDASGLPSGVYFYYLKASGYSARRR